MKQSERGIALVAVLWTLILLSIIAASFASETRTEARISHNMAENAAARAAADAGVQRAILGLLTSRVDPLPLEDGTIYNWQFGNSNVLISIQDERSKVDLNRAPAALLNVLFSFVGADPKAASALADTVADFRDSDNFQSIQGAEEANYRAAGFDWGPKNSRFDAVEELQQVLGVTPEIYDRLVPYITIYSIPVNPSLANQQLAEIFRNGGPNTQGLAASPGTVYSIRAEAKGIDGATFMREAIIQVIPNSTIPVRVLVWQAGA